MNRALLLLALLAGCSGVEYRALEVDARAKLEGRRRFVVLATRLVENDAFSDAPDLVRPLAGDYAPVGSAAWPVAPLDAAPAPLEGMLGAARALLLEKGYAPATSTEPPDLVLLVGHCTLQDGALHRVSVDVGGPLDGRFRRDLVSLDAKVDPGADADPVELVRDLVGALPEREE